MDVYWTPLLLPGPTTPRQGWLRESGMGGWGGWRGGRLGQGRTGLCVGQPGEGGGTGSRTDSHHQLATDMFLSHLTCLCFSGALKCQRCPAALASVVLHSYEHQNRNYVVKHPVPSQEKILVHALTCLGLHHICSKNGSQDGSPGFQWAP